MKRILTTIVIVIVVLGIFIYTRLTHEEQFALAVADPVVEVKSPDYGDIELTTSVIGTISNEENVSVNLKAGGDVTQVMVSVGDTVSEGELLFTVDTMQLEAAENSLNSASLNLRQAQDNLNRQSVLYAGGGISEQSYQSYVDSVTSAEIAYSNAEIAYNNQLSYTNITAPISGTIETLNVERLDSVSAGFLACVISGGNTKNVEFSVSERTAGNLSLGETITIEKESFQYGAHITEISSVVNETTGMFDVKAHIDEDEDTSGLASGSMVKLILTSEKVSNVMRVPLDAVYYEDEKSYVYTLDPAENIIHKKEVETGLYDGQNIEIVSGLSNSDEVVTTWVSELYEGSKVRLLKDESESGTTMASEQS